MQAAGQEILEVGEENGDGGKIAHWRAVRRERTPRTSAGQAYRVSPPSPDPSPVQGQRSPATAEENAPPVAQAEAMNRLLIAAVLAVTMLTSASAADAASKSRSPATKSHQVGQARRAAAVTPVGTRNPVTTAAAIAERFWGAIPCDGQINIVAASPLAPGLQAGTDAWVTFGSSLGADNLDAPASTYTACTITLAHWQWANWTAMEGDWGMFCLTVTHEMGHLLGHKHTVRVGSVMNPVFTDDSDVPAICNANWLPGWRTGGTA
jgi:hypothetical protein